MKVPLQTFTYFSLLFCIYNINNTLSFSLIVPFMSILKRIGAFGFLGVALGIGSAIAYYQVLKINKTIGDEILEYSLKTLRAEMEADNDQFNKDNKLHYTIEQLSNEATILARRIDVYLARLLNAKKYEDISLQVAKSVINPVIRNYEAQKVFQYVDIINQFKDKNEFNNKLASLLTKIQKQNAVIKGQHKLLLEDFYQLQQQLATAHVFGIGEETKKKIDILYSYFKKRQQYVAKLIGQKSTEPSSQIPSDEWMDELSYGFKIQFI